MARGFNKNALDKAWNTYANTRAKDLDDEDFSAAAESDPEKKQAILQRT